MFSSIVSRLDNLIIDSDSMYSMFSGGDRVSVKGILVMINEFNGLCVHQQLNSLLLSITYMFEPFLSSLFTIAHVF